MVSEKWGQEVIHVWDRGFAGTPWLALAFVHAARFVMRWLKFVSRQKMETPVLLGS